VLLHVSGDPGFPVRRRLDRLSRRQRVRCRGSVAASAPAQVNFESRSSPPVAVRLGSMVSNRHPLGVAPILVLHGAFEFASVCRATVLSSSRPTQSKGDSVANEADVVAVVNADADRVAIWHVVVSPSYPMSRLSGAWVDGTANHVATRVILPFGGQLPDALTHLASASAGVIDVPATLAAISERIAHLDKLHESSKNAAGKGRTPIDWPPLPPALDWTSPPSPPTGVVDEPLIGSTVGVARWVADLADTWSATESVAQPADSLDHDPLYSPDLHRRQSPTVGAVSAWMGNTVIASRSTVRT
jgi:hypothetical protein